MPDAARCQLYLAAPAILPPSFDRTLSAVLEAAEVACLRLPAQSEVADLIPLAQARGVAVVLDGGVELAAKLGADGVHLAGLPDYAAARQRLGADGIVGVHCGRSRHAAMEAGEAGADYIAFEPDLDLVRWWAELMEVPVVAELGDALERAADFAVAGAEFVAVGKALWRDAAEAPATAKLLGSMLC